jgi:hypothetical protein
VRFASAAALVNEMVEAKHQLQLGRALTRWARYDLIALDEVGYVPLAAVGAEFLFQVIAERAEKAAVIVTANPPFSEWTSAIPNARLCKAPIDRIAGRAPSSRPAPSPIASDALWKNAKANPPQPLDTAPPPAAGGRKEGCLEGGSLLKRETEERSKTCRGGAETEYQNGARPHCQSQVAVKNSFTIRRAW